eukprot:TRINITY_DN74093_c0_g1_i1.p1 TRINITY_DN74093_c0_g1~~TRINITY_DN74093_c0_g1_i1.p1  ORF type:complete len:352 (-),score=86.91 TRINITY_DN74093_c0_g1_i1:199-1254(-)
MSVTIAGDELGQSRRRRDDSERASEDGLPCDSNSAAAFGCGLLCLVIAAAVALSSISSVPPLKVAIKYNTFSKEADTAATFGPGRYFIGPFNQFLYFPSSIQNLEFTNEPRIDSVGVRYEPLHTRTKEGLGLHMKVSLQYRLRPTTLAKLYQEFNQDYEQVFISSVRDVLIKAASEYEANQLWEERERVGNEMQRLVDKELRETYAECWGLQLMVIDLPDTFEKTIVATQVQQQSMLTREQEQESTRIRAKTTVIQAEYERRVKVLMAAGHANYTVITKEAQALAQQNVIDAQAEALQNVKKRLSLYGGGLISYQKYDALDDLENASLFFGFSDASQVLLGGGGAMSHFGT